MKVVKITELQKQMGMIAIAGAIFIFLGVVLVVLPGLQRVNQLQNDVIDIDRKRDLLSQIQVAKTKITEGETWITEKKERHLILSYITTVAKRYGVVIDVAAPDPIEDVGKLGYFSFIIRLEVKSDFKSLFPMMVELGEANPKIVVDEMTLTRMASEEIQNEEDKEKTLRGEFILRTFLVSRNDASKSLGVH